MYSFSLTHFFQSNTLLRTLFILVPYSPSDNYLIKLVDSEYDGRLFSGYILLFSFLAWSSLDLDRVHLTPKQESRVQGKPNHIV